MTSLFRKPGSLFWCLSFRKGDRWLKKSLGLRADNPRETLLAREARAQAETQELKSEGVRVAVRDESGWERWLDKFLVRHCENTQTLKRYRGHWLFLAAWLPGSGFARPGPNHVKAALDYMEWRTTTKKKSGKTASWNTARNDLKVLSLALGGAVRLDFIASNPLARLGLKKEESAKKPKLDDDALQAIQAALVEEPEWMVSRSKSPCIRAAGCGKP